MARLFLNAGEQREVSVGNDYVYGSTGTERITVDGSPNAILDGNIEEVVFEHSVADYRFRVNGTNIEVLDADGGFVATFLGLNQDSTLLFADGYATLSLTGLNQATLGGTAITGVSAAVDPAEFMPIDTPADAFVLNDIQAVDNRAVIALNTADDNSMIVVENDANDDGKANISGSDAIDALRLTGDASVRVDLTDRFDQIEFIDIDGDGEWEPGTAEDGRAGAVGDMYDVSGFEIIDAHPRIEFLQDEDGNLVLDAAGNPIIVGNALLDPNDTVNGFTGDILLDGTGNAGDGVNTNGNIFLGGWGDDTALGGLGNDFFSGGGGENILSGGRNADYFYVELSSLDCAFTGQQAIKAGNTGDVAGVNGPQDSDWLLLEAADDQELTFITLGNVPNVSAPPVQGGVSLENGSLTRADMPCAGALLEDVENVNASGSFFGFLDEFDAQDETTAIAPTFFDTSRQFFGSAWNRADFFSFRLDDGTEVELAAELVRATLNIGDDVAELSYENWLDASILLFDVENGGEFEVEGERQVDSRFPNIQLDYIFFYDPQAETRNFILEGANAPDSDIVTEIPGSSTEATWTFTTVTLLNDFGELFFGDFRDFTPNGEAGIVRVPGLSPGATSQLDIAGTGERNILIGGYDNDVINAGSGNDLLFGGDLQFLMTHRNNANLFEQNPNNSNLGGIIANTRASGPTDIAVGDNVADDGRDTLIGGDGNDDIVLELDRGTYSGDGGNDTIWVTDFTAGRRQGDGKTPNFGTNDSNGDRNPFNDGNTGSEDLAIVQLTSDSVIRLDLGAGFGGEWQGFGGADDLVAGQMTADQTNYKSAGERTVVQGIESVNASGLGNVDYLTAGTNDPELVFDNQQNFHGTDIAMDLRGIDTRFVQVVDDNDSLDQDGDGEDPTDIGAANPNVNDGNFSETQMLHYVAGINQVVSLEGPVQPIIEGGFDYNEFSPSMLTDLTRTVVETDYGTLRGDVDGSRMTISDNGGYRLDSDQDVFQSDDSLATARVDRPEQNSLVSGTGNDTIEGRGGDDRLSGRQGDDLFIISLNDGDNDDEMGLGGDNNGPRSDFGDNVNFISRDMDIFSYYSDAVNDNDRVVVQGVGNGSDGIIDRVDTAGYLSNDPTDRVLIGQDFRAPQFGEQVTPGTTTQYFIVSTTTEFRTDEPGTAVNNGDFGPFEPLKTLTLTFSQILDDRFGSFAGSNQIVLDLGESVTNSLQLRNAIDAALPSQYNVKTGSTNGNQQGNHPYGFNDSDPDQDGILDFDLNPNDAVEISFAISGNVPSIVDVDLSIRQQFESFQTIGGYDVVIDSASTPEIIVPAGPEDDRLVFASYNNRLDNELAADRTEMTNGSYRAESLGKEAYAEDLVVRFDGTSTMLAEGQQYDIYFDDLAKGDIVHVSVNGVTHTLAVGFDQDENDIGGETTESFVARMATLINVARANDPHTAAGSVVATVINDVPGNAGDENDAVLVLRQAPSVSGVDTFNINAARAEQVFMDLPVVIIDEDRTGGDDAIAIVKDNSDTSVVLFGYDGRPQAQGLNRSIDPANDRAEDREITFEGYSEENRAILQTADPDGDNNADSPGNEELMGLHAYQDPDNDGRWELAIDTQNPGLDREGDTGNTGGLSSDTNSGIGEPGTSTGVLDGWAALHGDDLLIGSDPIAGAANTGNDAIDGLTGDDRIMGSKGNDVVDGGGDIRFRVSDGEVINVIGPDEADNNTAHTFANTRTGLGVNENEGIVRFIDTLTFEERHFLNDTATNNPAFRIVVTGNGAGQVLVDEDTSSTPFVETIEHTTTFTDMEIVRTFSGNDRGTQLADDDLDLRQLGEGHFGFILHNDPAFHVDSNANGAIDDGDDLLPGFMDGAGNQLLIEVSPAAWDGEGLPHVNALASGAISVRALPDGIFADFPRINGTVVPVYPIGEPGDPDYVSQDDIDAAFMAANELLIVEGVEKVLMPTEPAAVGRLDVSDNTVREDIASGEFKFTVTRTNTSVNDIQYEILRLPATDPRLEADQDDFIGAAAAAPGEAYFEGPVAFEAGSSTAVIALGINDDEVFELEQQESFIIRVFSASNALQEDQSEGVIVDDETSGLVAGIQQQLDDLGAVSEGDDVSFTVGLVAIGGANPGEPTTLPEDVTINFVIEGIDPNPTDADDFELVTGQFTIAAGQSSASVDVAALLDGVTEETENFQVVLTEVVAGPTNVQLLPDSVLAGGTLENVDNQAPDAAATVTPNPVEEGADVTFDASASTDADGDRLSFSWVQVIQGDEPDLGLGTITGAVNTLPAPEVDADTDFTFELTVDDGSVTDTLLLTLSVTDVPEMVDVDLDDLGGAVGDDPVFFDAGAGSFNFIDSIARPNNTEIEGFGDDDQITYNGLVTPEEVEAGVAYQESDGHVQLETDNGAGVASQIVLLDSAVGVFGVGEFNDTPDLGDILPGEPIVPEVEIVDLSLGDAVGQDGVAEVFVYEFTVVEGRATNIGDAEVSITNFNAVEDSLRFDDGTDTVTTEGFTDFPGVVVNENPFSGETVIAFDADAEGVSGAVTLVGVLDADLVGVPFEVV